MSARDSGATSNFDDLQIAVDNGKPVRIGENGGSLNQELVMRKMQENIDQNLGKESEDIINECMGLERAAPTELALESGLTKQSDHHFVKTSRPRERIPVHRDFVEVAATAASGLTEAGMGTRAKSGRRLHSAFRRMTASAT